MNRRSFFGLLAAIPSLFFTKQSAYEHVAGLAPHMGEAAWVVLHRDAAGSITVMALDVGMVGGETVWVEPAKGDVIKAHADGRVTIHTGQATAFVAVRAQRADGTWFTEWERVS